ncbi:MAG: hypothetical protein U0T82_05555 [Bacteroidales bacterium]
MASSWAIGLPDCNPYGVGSILLTAGPPDYNPCVADDQSSGHGDTGLQPLRGSFHLS